MASGDVVNTASRLQSAAPTNGILVDETTYRATAPAIEYREAEPVRGEGEGGAVAGLGSGRAAVALRRGRRAARAAPTSSAAPRSSTC